MRGPTLGPASVIWGELHDLALREMPGGGRRQRKRVGSLEGGLAPAARSEAHLPPRTQLGGGSRDVEGASLKWQRGGLPHRRSRSLTQRLSLGRSPDGGRRAHLDGSDDGAPFSAVTLRNT